MRRYGKEVFRYIFEYDSIVQAISKISMVASVILWLIIAGNWLYPLLNYNYISQTQFNQLIASSILYTLLLSLSIAVAFLLPYYAVQARPSSFRQLREARLRDIIFIGSLILLLVVITIYTILGYYYMKTVVG